MLEIVTGESRRSCQGTTRREFLRIGTLGLGGISLASLLASKAVGPGDMGGAFAPFQVGGDSQVNADMQSVRFWKMSRRAA